MDDTYFKKIMTIVIIGALLILSYFLLKPVLLAVLFGIILAFIFTPVYDWLYRKTRLNNISAFIVCILLLVIILVPLVFLIPILIEQSIKLFLASQQLDFVTPFQKFFPSLSISEEFSLSVANTIQSFITKLTNSLMTKLGEVVLEIPMMTLQLFIVFFTLFYVVRDKEKLVSYVKSLLPFSHDIEAKLLKSSRDITSAIIYGLIIIGIMQGAIAGLGFFIFGVPNALLLTLFAIIVGILPILGPFIVWVPVAIYLLAAGNAIPAIGVSIFGILSSVSDNFVRPLLLSKRTQLNPVLALVGMIGGILLFGVLGIVLGPLILSYLTTVLEIFRKKA
jgi:predicted PurR-regulated permease PerM